MTLTLRRLLASGVTAAVLAVGALTGCADGTHPGAAAVVGDTEISVEHVDEVSRSVTTALGQSFGVSVALSELVRSEIVRRVVEQRSVEVSDAETAQAMRAVIGDPATYQRFEQDPVAFEFLRSVSRSALGIVKLGGGDSLTGPDAQQAGQSGARIVSESARDIDVTVSPRFGRWSGDQIARVSGSLSVESDQTRRQREQQQQAEPQG